MTHADVNDYDAGLLNDWGGGNVDWWQDYLRAEISRTNDYWRGALEAAEAKLAEADERGARICEILFRKGVLPEKWQDYFRVRSAGDNLLAAHEARKGEV